MGRPDGLVFPRRDGLPWRRTDVNNWRRRVPELAEQLGHSPQMTLSTYAHVMRELKGFPALSAEEQSVAARESRRPS